MPANWGTTETPRQASYSGAKDYRNAMSAFLQKFAQQASPMSLADKPWSADQYTKMGNPLAGRTIELPAFSPMIRRTAMMSVGQTRKK